MEMWSLEDSPSSLRIDYESDYVCLNLPSRTTRRKGGEDADKLLVMR